MAHMSGGQITECRGLCPDVPPLHAVLTILMKEDIICFFRCPGEDFDSFLDSSCRARCDRESLADVFLPGKAPHLKDAAEFMLRKKEKITGRDPSREVVITQLVFNEPRSVSTQSQRHTRKGRMNNKDFENLACFLFQFAQ
ncbi:hypothetical protein CEXT_125081 [Caerostris extrusa]|uniref:Uncharacterized protein n=1 Tax=Caerostris extrusa TaxID=172846 RepID=A0AAV4S3C7_CAEEX|nr:hypothetical protein CEXT_125081 [Caerostris extrusa]